MATTHAATAVFEDGRLRKRLRGISPVAASVEAVGKDPVGVRRMMPVLVSSAERAWGATGFGIGPVGSRRIIRVGSPEGDSSERDG
jgi:hypothetical protein